MEGFPESEVQSLKLLRILVTVLTVVMIVGFIVLIGVLVTRFPNQRPLPLPDAIILPDGSAPAAVTFGPGWYAVVTNRNQLLIYDRITGEMLQTIPLNAGE